MYASSQSLPFFFLSFFSLLYLHTGSPMPGVVYPLVWKSSPSRTEIAIISKCHENEKSLAQVYLDNQDNDPYCPPSVAQLCTLAVGIVRVVDQLHAKRIRHGGLRPDVIGVWQDGGQIQICIRDFSESRLLGESETPASTPPPSEDASLNIAPSVSVHYLPPETLGTSQPGKRRRCIFGSLPPCS
jgi:hypothetical protein